ncbi:MAG: peptide ABC transporter substrate-binding protein [Pirellulaceae bacterium]|nr:MAG: peptide ABC transporter substrate-binding protein [Pirellulaceae bacterium]
MRPRAASRTSRCCLYLAAICASVGMGGPALGQEIEQIEPPLIDQQPFDLIILTEEEGGEQVKVYPIPFPDRQLPPPDQRKPTDRLEVVLLKFPDRRYEITWKAIKDILLYERRIYQEAVDKMREKDFVTAFQNLSYLLKNYPEMEGLEELRRQFLLESAQDRFRKGELRQTLSALEELAQTAPDYRPDAVRNALSRVVDALVTEYEASGDLGNAKQLLSRIRDLYGDDLPVVQKWQQKLLDMAMERKEKARALMAKGRYREARQAVVEMLSILPELEEAQQLLAEINRIHPMVRVGVMQRSDAPDPSSLIDWPARRTGQLIYRSLFQFVETGAEGGQYDFALGSYRLTDDRRQLILILDSQHAKRFPAYLLAQWLVDRANPLAPDYDPSWAAVVDSVASGGAQRLVVNLRRQNVLPHALLQWKLPDDEGAPGSFPGPYRIGDRDERETSFVLREAPVAGQPVEVVEVFYEDPKEAVNDLLRGEIDVLDQLYPADARRLTTMPQVEVHSYALPTSHFLIPVSEHPFLTNVKFRRALLYATDRENVLRGELLDSDLDDDGRLLSGPFPVGNQDHDTLAYAHNPHVPPVDYSPHLARLLLVMAKKELEAAAEKNDEPAPQFTPLVVGCPNYEFARVAVQALIQQWKNVGVDAEMKLLPPTQIDASHGCDLVYVIATMWEPATDIERLLGGNGIARTDNPYLIHELERLRRARNWREVRAVMQEMHQLIAYHLPILPLWQVHDRFAVSKNLSGIEDKPVSLYENIQRWKLPSGRRQYTSR